MIKSRFFTYPSFLLFTTQATFSSYLLIKSAVGYTSVKKHLVNPQMLSFLYSGEKSRFCDSFRTGLQELSSLGVLTSVGDDYYVYENTPLESNFGIIYEEEFESIIHSGKNNAMSLLLHFCRLMKSLDYIITVAGNNNIVGHMTSLYFSTTYGTSYNSVLNYNKALEELGVLYVHHAGFNSKSQQSNLYGRKCDEQLIRQYAHRFDNSSKSNFHRSVSAKYNRFVKDPKSFSSEDAERLYSDCIKYNKDVVEMGCPEKAKPLDIIKARC